MAYFDTQCLEALQKIATELQKIRQIMEKEQDGGLNGENQ